MQGFKFLHPAVKRLEYSLGLLLELIDERTRFFATGPVT